MKHNLFVKAFSIPFYHEKVNNTTYQCRCSRILTVIVIDEFVQVLRIPCPHIVYLIDSLCLHFVCIAIIIRQQTTDQTLFQWRQLKLPLYIKDHCLEHIHFDRHRFKQQDNTAKSFLFNLSRFYSSIQYQCPGTC